MNKYKKLASNSFIFTIGSIGSKLIGFIMLPLYTKMLNAAEFGTVDLIATSVPLIIPYLSLELGQASLRFAVETNDELYQSRIFKNITIHGLFSIIFVLLISSIVFLISKNKTLVILFALLVISSLFEVLYSHFSRGIGLIRQYALNGILMALVTVISNLILLVALRLKVIGYTASLVLATSISVLYLYSCIRKRIEVKPLQIDKNMQKKMLKYSLPIVPNSTMWWLVSSSTRYCILYFVGVSANGLFAVANRIPGVIAIVTSIFSQAWQLSSFEEYDSKDIRNFYSNILSIYAAALFILASLINVIIKPFTSVWLERSYYDSWKLVPVLLLAVIFQSLNIFFGTIYTASKKTKGTLITSSLGAVTSLVLNILFISTLKLDGAGFATLLSFLFMFLYRAFDTRKIIEINIHWNKIILNVMILIVQYTMQFRFEGWTSILVQSFLLILLVIVNSKEIKSLRSFVVKTMRRQRI